MRLSACFIAMKSWPLKIDSVRLALKTSEWYPVESGCAPKPVTYAVFMPPLAPALMCGSNAARASGLPIGLL